MFVKLKTKKRLKQILILEVISIVFCISILAKQGTSNNNGYIANMELNYQETELSKSMKRGEEIYIDFCIQCHLGDGKGTPKVFPPLAGSDWLVNKRKESIHSIKYGLNGPIKVNGVTYNSAMTPLGLENEEVAHVMNYIMNSWGNKQEKIVTLEEVTSVKK